MEILIVHHNAAAGGDNLPFPAQYVVEHALFQLAKIVLAFLCEDFPHLHPFGFLNQRVEIDKAPMQPLR
jgi:hypothetical protein